MDFFKYFFRTILFKDIQITNLRLKKSRILTSIFKTTFKGICGFLKIFYILSEFFERSFMNPNKVVFWKWFQTVNIDFFSRGFRNSFMRPFRTLNVILIVDLERLEILDIFLLNFKICPQIIANFVEGLSNPK